MIHLDEVRKEPLLDPLRHRPDFQALDDGPRIPVRPVLEAYRCRSLMACDLSSPPWPMTIGQPSSSVSDLVARGPRKYVPSASPDSEGECASVLLRDRFLRTMAHSEWNGCPYPRLKWGRALTNTSRGFHRSSIWGPLHPPEVARGIPCLHFDQNDTEEENELQTMIPWALWIAGCTFVVVVKLPMAARKYQSSRISRRRSNRSRRNLIGRLSPNLDASGQTRSGSVRAHRGRRVHDGHGRRPGRAVAPIFSESNPTGFEVSNLSIPSGSPRRFPWAFTRSPAPVSGGDGHGS